MGEDKRRVVGERTQGRFRDQVPPSPPTITNHDDLLNTSRYECIGQHLRSRPPLAPSERTPTSPPNTGRQSLNNGPPRRVVLLRRARIQPARICASRGAACRSIHRARGEL